MSTLFDLFERLSSLMRIWHREHPLLAELQPVQFSALQYLSRCNGYSDTPLAVTDYLGLTKGTVSQSLKVLEAKGLIEKRPDLADKRSVHLVLTPLARELLRELTPPDFLARALAAMEGDAAELERLLARLLRTIQQQEDVPGFGVCKTCRFHQQRDGEPHCGLTGEALSRPAAELICREHQPRDEAA
ncbi:MarR family transcriptional regulator [Pseudomonas sp. A46]|nr:MarR family winged helix-turn-helix transcriptional regulator [Pseudomonas sp. A46]OWJ96160.1 MarR family transcriptional regulator [Pseudomonas sp. A46]